MAGMTIRAALVWLAVPLAVVVGLVATTPGRYALPVVGLLCLGLAVLRPRLVLLLGLPVALWPTEAEPLGVPLGFLAAAAVIATLLIARPVKIGWLPFLLVAGFGTFATLGLLTQPGPYVVGEVIARNHLAASMLGLGLLLAVAVSGVSRLRALRVLALTGAASCLYLLTISSGWTVAGGRLEAGGLNPNAVGQVAAMAAMTALGCVVATRQARWVVLLVPAAAVLALAQSRGSVVMLAAGLSALWLLARTSRVRVIVATLMPLAVFALWPAVHAAIGLFTSRRINVGGESIRLETLRVAARLAAEHPIVGVGWRAFPDYSIRSLGVDINVHNEYLRIAAEAGLVALACWLLLIVMALRARTATAADRACKAAVVAGLVGLALSNTMSSLPATGPTFVLIGLLLAGLRGGASGPGGKRATPEGAVAAVLHERADRPVRQRRLTA